MSFSGLLLRNRRCRDLGRRLHAGPADSKEHIKNHATTGRFNSELSSSRTNTAPSRAALSRTSDTARDVSHGNYLAGFRRDS